MRSTSVFVACLVLLGSLAATAQNAPATGLYTFGSFDSPGFDTINRGNLNAHFTIPIISKQGRGGTNYYYALNYDGLVWSPTSSSGTSQWTPIYEWGWTDNTNAEFGYITYNEQVTTCGQVQNLQLEEEANDFVFHDAHGIQHPFPMTWNSGCGGTLGPPTGTGTYATYDNSGYTIYHSNSTYIAFSKGGAQSAVVALPNPFQGGGAGTFTDTNGNEISASASGVFTDTTGKTVLTVTGSGTPSSPMVYAYTDSNGNPQTVTVNYTAIDVLTRFGCSGIAEYGPVVNNLVTSIVYSADGSSYTFAYEQTPGFPGHVTGRVASVTLPTGGTISYAYSGGACSGGIEPDGTNATLARTTTDSTTPTTYTRSAITSTGSTTTIVNPVNNAGVYDFLINSSGYFYETSHSLYTNGISGTPVEQVTTCYNATYPCSSQDADNGISSLETNTVRDGVAIGTDTQTYTGPELLASDAGPTEITTTNTYQTFTGAYSIPFYRLSTQKITASGTTNAETDYDYDETAVTPISAPQHVAPSWQRGNLTSIHRLVSGTTKITAATMTYDGGGQVLTTTDANNNPPTTYGYDSGTDTFLTKVTRPTTNGVAHISSAIYDIQSGLMTSSTDENSQTTAYTYDGLERPKTISYPDGGETTFSYTPTSTTQAVLQSGATTLNTTVDVDGYGRTISVDSPNGSEVDTVYGTAGRVHQTTNPHFSTTSPTDGTTTYTYDVLNRVTSVENPDGTSRSASFSGLTETLTDESGNQKQYVMDALGRIVKVLEPNSTNGGLTWETDYTWNALNELYTVTQKGDGSGNRARTFNYDDEGRLTSLVTPEQGTTSFGYDNNSNLTSRVDARNITTTYTYDALNRKLTETAPSINYHYVYDTISGLPASSYAVGRLVYESNYVNADEIYSYDPMGRLNWEASWTPSQPNNTAIIAQAQYDKAGEMASLTYPDGRVVTNTYPDGQLNSVTYTEWGTQSENVPYLSSASYGPPGNVTGETFGNGVQMVGANNSRVLLSSLLYKTTAATLWSKQYTWAPNGTNLKTLTDALNSANTMSYTYDPDNRIASASATGVSETYTPDAFGNLKQSGTYSFQQNFSVNNQISATGYTYDAAGDLTADGNGNTYSYNADEMITASSGASYVYDALDQRVAKAGGSNAGETIYFNGVPIALHNPSNPPTDAYTDLLYANGTMIAEVAGTQTAVPTYRISDHLSSLAAQINNSGGVTGTDTFLPFGQTLNSTTTDSFQFTGLPQDTENSSYHAGYRNFSYEQGRWLSPDPYNGSYDVTNPQSFNRYSYVNNNPMGFIDPSGLKVTGICVLFADYSGSVSSSDRWGQGSGYSFSDPGEEVCFGDGGYSGLLSSGGGGGGTSGNGNNSNPAPNNNQQKPQPCAPRSGSPSMGVSASASTINPFTSGGGGVVGANQQSFGATTNNYTYSGHGAGLDVGVSIQSVWAWGSGSWTGPFRSVNFAAGPFAGSIFWTPGKGGWTGFSWGLGAGLPGLAYEETNYTCRSGG